MPFSIFPTLSLSTILMSHWATLVANISKVHQPNYESFQIWINIGITIVDVTRSVNDRVE